MTVKYYVLDSQHRVVEESDLMLWSRFFGDLLARRVASDKVGKKHVSTVFLGFDHSFDPDGPPQFFETMVFNSSPHQGYVRRYSTWTRAAAGHSEVVQRLRDGLPLPGEA